MKGLPYLVAALLIGGCIPQPETPPIPYADRYTAPPDLGPHQRLGETWGEFIARVMALNACEKAAAEEVAHFAGDTEIGICEQKNPELGRKLRAEHEKFLAHHPIQHYSSGPSYSEPYRPPASDPLEQADKEAEKAEQQYYHDQEIRTDQQMLDWALEPLGR